MRNRLASFIFAVGSLVGGLSFASATTLPDGFSEELLAGGFNSPTTMAFSPNGWLAIAEQDGTIRLYRDGHLYEVPVFKVHADSQFERGLLGLAFDPGFPARPYLYVYYTAASPTSHNRLSRLTLKGEVATVERKLIDFPPIQGAIWHMGGAMRFGPDGKLFIGIGDHLIAQASPSLTSFFGKIIRVNRNGTIPSDNPFYQAASGLNRAIWARGLRNPFTLDFQPGTGRLFLNEVGQNGWEEINEGSPGADFGWPATEGATTEPGVTSPVFAYTHEEGCAITGGAFYNPPTVAFPASYLGQYFFLDFCSGWLRTLDPTTGQTANFATDLHVWPVNLRVGPDGNLYYLSRRDGSLFRIAADAAPKIVRQPESQLVSDDTAVEFSVQASGKSPFAYQWMRNGAEIPEAQAATYRIEAASLADHGAIFSVRVRNALGSVTSEAATLRVLAEEAPSIEVASPLPGAMFSGGDTIAYAASATDEAGAPLPAKAFTWTIDYHHHTHVHPFMPATNGRKSGSFDVPKAYQGSIDVFYRITLRVRNQSNLTSVVMRDVHPRVATLQFASSPSGFPLRFEDIAFMAPRPIEAIVGTEVRVAAPSVVEQEGETYALSGWSDGGVNSHMFTVPPEGVSLTATYGALPAVYLSDLTWLDGSTNGWGPAERDSSVGENAAGDGRPLSIAGVGYARGIGAHAASDLRIPIPQGASRFLAAVGVDDETNRAGSVVFTVAADETILHETGTVIGGDQPIELNLPLTTQAVLRLQAGDAGDGTAYDHADWANARFLIGGVTLPPAAPGELHAEKRVGGVQLTWLDYADNEAGFQVERWKSGRFVEIARVPADATRYFDQGAPIGSAYRVHAFNVSGPSDNTPMARGERRRSR